jgi:hypothetical protein
MTALGPKEICSVDRLFVPSPRRECLVPTFADLPSDDKLSARLRSESLLVSPSGQWTAWAKYDMEPMNPNLVGVYLAPTAELLQP